ncbi:amino acid-binding protein [Pseudoalteromonas sp. NBT06-2]|uniref:ACT domain-containing protein n=1 Tax=Pseudoalteromonas sp. NBT06-2 TaxID=2025950 RepID=UPI000BA749D7|nr:ACT domain-containing protein [Pseudoalteromonas sp. NBT06-2]PAJ72108.1 amino acid-binding protein [Pseudoalteromonas sp. NBT06-2]
MSKQSLELMKEAFTIHSFDPSEQIPEKVYSATVFFIAKTYDELSIVCPDSITLNSNESESGWAALEVLGPLGFSMTGILSNISGILAQEKISIFAISTFDTDYILIKQEFIENAINSLQQDGYNIINGQ